MQRVCTGRAGSYKKDRGSQQGACAWDWTWRPRGELTDPSVYTQGAGSRNGGGWRLCVSDRHIHIYTHTNGHTRLFIHTSISQLWPTRGPRSKDTPLVMRTWSSLVSQQHCPQKQQGSLQKWSVPELEQGEDRMTWNISPRPKGSAEEIRGMCQQDTAASLVGPSLPLRKPGTNGAT